MTTEISLSEVKKHNNKKSLWIVIHNQVYDVTKFLVEHPGGEDALLEYAGTDGTQAFEDVGHSEDARELLKTLKIGTLPPGEKQKNTPTCCQRRSTSSPSSRTPSEGILKKESKTWRTFDGSSCSDRKPKSDHKMLCEPKAERRIEAIVIPRERQPREMPCERKRRPPPPASSNKLKWALVALAGAIVVGIVLQKYMS